MQLPAAERAVVPRPKVMDYLLSSTHPEGRGKAAVFRRCGFSPASWEQLAGALGRHAISYPVARVEPSPLRHPYVIEGTMETPAGLSPLVRSVWFVRHGDDAPRLVTTYPLNPR